MKKNLVKYMLRLMGIVIVSIILLFALNIIFAISGNPIKIIKARNVLEKYAEKKYNVNGDYVLGDIEYKFAPGLYCLKLQNIKYYDDHFNIYYDPQKKKIYDNEYTENVLSKKNTMQRIVGDLKHKIMNIFNRYLLDKDISIENIKIEKDILNKVPNDINYNSTYMDLLQQPVILDIINKNDYNDIFDIAVNIRMIKRILMENNIIINDFDFTYNYNNKNFHVKLNSNDISDTDILNILKAKIRKRNKFEE